MHCPDLQQSQLQVMFCSLIELVWAENAGAVYSYGEPPFDPLRIPLAAFVGFQRFGVVAQHGFEGGLCAGFDAVIDPFVPSHCCENPSLAEGLQMRGERRLTHLHGVGKLADAKLALEQRCEDSDASRIGEGSAKEDDIVHGFTSGNDDMIPQVPFPLSKRTMKAWHLTPFAG